MKLSFDPSRAPPTVLAIVVATAAGCRDEPEPDPPRTTPAAFPVGESLALTITRGLPEHGTEHGIDLLYVDPDSPRFGTFLQRFTDLPYEGGAPPHHLYYSPTGRLYATGLDPRCSLMHVDLKLELGKPVVEGVTCIPTGGHVVGEDMLWRTVGGRELMYVTFMGGKGTGDMLGHGSVVAFDAASHQIVAEIVDPDDPDDPDDPFVMYPHGITALGDTMIVSSTIVPTLDISSPRAAIGDTISVIDMARNEVVETRVVDVSPKPDGQLPSSPVEVLFLRPEIHPDLPSGVLVNTMFGGDIWYATYEADRDPALGEFSRIYTGSSEGTGVPLEFYTYEQTLYVSHGHPGVIKQYRLDRLPALESAGPDFRADPGAHHLIFFETRSGRALMASQNNLLDLRDTLGMPLSAHTLTVHDQATAQRVATVDFLEKYGLGLANIVGALDSEGTIGEEWFTHHH